MFRTADHARQEQAANVYAGLVTRAERLAWSEDPPAEPLRRATDLADPGERDRPQVTRLGQKGGDVSEGRWYLWRCGKGRSSERATGVEDKTEPEGDAL